MKHKDKHQHQQMNKHFYPDEKTRCAGCGRYFTDWRMDRCPNCGQKFCHPCFIKHWHNED